MLSIIENLNADINSLKEFYDEIITVDANRKQATILKSSSFLMLYNIVERTVFCTLTLVHDELCQYKFCKLDNKIQINFINYFSDNQNLQFPSFEDYTKKNKIFSGNLDGKKINAILKKYKIPCLTSNERKKLLFLKNKRNKLAHGEETFRQASRNTTISELKILIDSVEKTLHELLLNVKNYIDNKLFLISRHV